MSAAGFNEIADAIEANLEHLHRERWNERTAELHAQVAHPPEGVSPEQAAQALRDHYDDRFRPESSRVVLLKQAAMNLVTKRGDLTESLVDQ